MRCQKRGSQNNVTVQVAKAFVIVAKTARYKIGPHIKGCAIYSISQSIKLNEKSSYLYIELLV